MKLSFFFRTLAATVALLSVSWAQTPSGYAFSLLAGRSAATGSVDGEGRAASFSTPAGVAVDQEGNIYVADTVDHTIRRITPSGTVTTWAGASGQIGSADGPRATARFNAPHGVAVDDAGNVYVADTDNHTIRKITAAGIVSTFAGQAGAAGSANGVGSAARFNRPSGVAVYPGGNFVYVADTQNHTIREITPSGAVTTFAGIPGQRGNTEGARDQALFTYPTNVAVYFGWIYVTGRECEAVRAISPTGLTLTIAGNPDLAGSDDGVTLAARFADPAGLAVDRDGNLYVADSINNTIRRITPLGPSSSGGVVTTITGRARTAGSLDGARDRALLNFPMAVAVDGAGNLIVADLGNAAIRKVAPSGEVSTVAGNASAGSDDGSGRTARFNLPGGVAVDLDGNTYVADTLNNTIRKITPAGVVSTFAGAAGQFGSADGAGAVARFDFPLGLAVDRAGNLYTTSNGASVRKITPAGVVTTIAGEAGTFGDADGPGRTARFSIPNGLAVAADGSIYVADQENSTIRRIAPDGTVSTVAGTAGQRGGVDGTGRAARFVQPAGLALDAAGNLYVADRGDFTVRKITPAGVVTTLAGQHGTPGTTDGTGTAARFAAAGGLAIDRTGTLLVADAYNRIRAVTPTGVVTTLRADTEGFPVSDGRDDLALANLARNVATDLAGNLYLTDGANNTVRKGVSTTKMINLSVRTRVGTGDQTPIMGFVLSAGAPKAVLIRGVGPTLGTMGVTGVTIDPQVKLLDRTSTLVQENNDWGGGTVLSQAFVAAGAFPLPATSKDAALLATLTPGLYSAQASAAGNAGGVTLLEAYDNDVGATSRLVNVSIRTVADLGDNTLIAGFVLAGTAPKTVLIRAAGPSLARQGVGAASLLADPRLTLFRGPSNIDNNDNWAGTPELKAAGRAVGAFEFDGDTSKDAALLATLAPGAYTVQVTGAGNGTGVALVEVYELP